MFQPIKILSIDEEMTSHGRQDGTPVYDIYLTLSSMPPPAWIRAFDERRRNPTQSMWRRARATSKWIVITCPLEELKRHHIPGLKADVDYANQQAAEAEEKMDELAEQYKADQERERLRIKALNDDLDL